MPDLQIVRLLDEPCASSQFGVAGSSRVQDTEPFSPVALAVMDERNAKSPFESFFCLSDSRKQVRCASDATLQRRCLICACLYPLCTSLL